MEESDQDDCVDDEEESFCRDTPEGIIRLRPSQFKGIPPTVFVEYPKELQLERNDVSYLEEIGRRTLGYKSHWERICIRNAFNRSGFSKVDSDWTALWSKHQNPSQMQELNCLQKVNHFPASWCIGRKDRLVRTINAMKRIHHREFNFHPDSYVTPSEKDSFLRQIASESSGGRSNKELLWIMKPVASSCGKGIKVLTSQQAVAAVTKGKKALFQKYLHNPYLIDGKKFDLRIYVLVCGVDPLRIYIFNEGLTRISTSTYSLKNISNRFAHLTNYSINKKSKDFKAASMDCGEGLDREGFKWSLAAFKSWLSDKESPAIMEQTFARIHDLCIKTIIAAESSITSNLHSVANYRTNCFELFGMDIILDCKLNPILLEVNVSPSLMGSSPLDKKIKGTLISDVFHIVGFYPHDSKLLRKYESASARGSDSNPFTFTSLSKLMSCQDEWRKDPQPSNINLASLGDMESAWYLLLMIDDEFARSQSSGFKLVHPLPSTVVPYLSLYKNTRFSDHLLGKWVLCRASGDPSLLRLIPSKFSPNDSSLLADMRIRVHSPDYATPTFSSPRKIKEADSILAPSRLKSELGESDLMEESEKVVSRKSRLVREIVGLRIAAKDSATLPDDFGPPILQSSDQTFSGRESSAVVRLKEKCRQHGNVRSRSTPPLPTIRKTAFTAPNLHFIDTQFN